MRQPLLCNRLSLVGLRDLQEVGVSAGADFGNGLLKHSKDPFLKGLRSYSLRSDNVAEPTTDLFRCKQFPFPQDSTCLITPAPGDLFCLFSPCPYVFQNRLGVYFISRIRLEKKP